MNEENEEEVQTGGQPEGVAGDWSDDGLDFGQLLETAIDPQDVDATLRKFAADCIDILVNNNDAAAEPLIDDLARRVGATFLHGRGRWNRPEQLGWYLLHAENIPKDTPYADAPAAALKAFAWDTIRVAADNVQADRETAEQGAEGIEAALEWLRNSLMGIPNDDGDGGPSPDLTGVKRPWDEPEPDVSESDNDAGRD